MYVLLSKYTCHILETVYILNPYLNPNTTPTPTPNPNLMLTWTLLLTTLILLLPS